MYNIHIYIYTCIIYIYTYACIVSAVSISTQVPILHPNRIRITQETHKLFGLKNIILWIW